MQITSFVTSVHTQLMFVPQQHSAPTSAHIAERTAAFYTPKQYVVDLLSDMFY